jgi:hypothetical protein
MATSLNAEQRAWAAIAMSANGLQHVDIHQHT